MTVKTGQIYNEVCPFDNVATGKQVEVIRVDTINGKRVCKLRVIRASHSLDIDSEVTGWIDGDTIAGYEIDPYSPNADADGGQPQTLTQYIDCHHNSNKADFARSQGVNPQQVTRWVNKGFIVLDNTLYSPLREIIRVIDNDNNQ